MKILPKHHSLRSLYYWLAVIGFVTIALFSGAIVLSLKSHLILFVLAILLMFFPDRLSLQNEGAQNKLGFIKCVGFTWILQICVYLSFYTICNLAGTNMPLPPHPQALFQMTLPVLTDTWGFFPWGACALMAAGLSYLRHSGREATALSNLVSIVFKNKPEDLMSLTADVGAKGMMAFVLITTLGLIGMECVGLIAHYLGLPTAYGPRVDVILAVFLILHWNKVSVVDQYLKGLLRKKSFPCSFVISLFLLLAVILIWVVACVIGSFSPKFTPRLSFVMHFSPVDWVNVWLIFVAAWWLSWIPLMSGWLAYVWRGHKIRTMIFWMLLLPIGAGVLSHTDFLWHLPFTFDASLWNAIPALLSLCLLYALFFKPQVMAYIAKANVPMALKEYHRAPKVFLRQVLEGIGIVMGVYWLMGIYGLGWAWFVILHTVLLLVFVGGIAGFWQVVFSKSLEHRRLAKECAKLDVKLEQKMADEGLYKDHEEWPEH